MDDEALVELARRGDRDAFEMLVRRHQDPLYTMALRLLGTPADAADVVQETFLRAYVGLPRLRGASVRSWLFRVAVNACHDVHRRSARRPTRSLDAGDGTIIDLPDPVPGPESQALAAERAAAVREALLGLTTEFRSAIVLRDVNQLSYEEIGDVLHIPVGTAKSRVARGRSRLAQALALSGAFPEGSVASGEGSAS